MKTAGTGLGSTLDGEDCMNWGKITWSVWTGRWRLYDHCEVCMTGRFCSILGSEVCINWAVKTALTGWWRLHVLDNADCMNCMYCMYCMNCMNWVKAVVDCEDCMNCMNWVKTVVDWVVKTTWTGLWRLHELGGEYYRNCVVNTTGTVWWRLH